MSKLGPVAKAVAAAVAGAVVPFVSVLIETGTVDERAVSAAVATSVISALAVYFKVNATPVAD